MLKYLLGFPLLFSSLSASPLSDALKAVGEKCTIDLQYASVSSCPDGEDGKVKAIIDADGMVKSLPDLGNAFASKDEKLSAATMSYIYNYRTSLGDALKNPKLVSPKTADTFIKGLEQNKTYASYYAAELTTVLATLQKKDAALFKVLDAHPQNATRNEGYRHALYQGRLRNFDRIKKAATDTKREYLADAAFNAPEYMYNYSEKEKEVICEWAKKNLDHEKPRYAAYSARTLVLRCLGSYIDDVLDKAEKLKAEGKLGDHPMREALTNFTFSCQAYMGSEPTGSQAQCARKEVLLRP